MSMIFCLSSIADTTISKVQSNPQLLWHIVNPEYLTMQMEKTNKKGFWSRLFGNKNENPESNVPMLELSDDERIEMDLDKAWHGIHFLLSGSDWQGEWPLNFLLGAGETVKDIDFGYGEARIYTAAEVEEIDQALQAISKEEFDSRFDPEKMIANDIYPTIWDRPKEEDDTLGYIHEYFLQLKSYIHRLAEKKMGLTVWLC